MTNVSVCMFVVHTYFFSDLRTSFVWIKNPIGNQKKSWVLRVSWSAFTDVTSPEQQQLISYIIKHVSQLLQGEEEVCVTRSEYETLTGCTLLVYAVIVLEILSVFSLFLLTGFASVPILVSGSQFTFMSCWLSPWCSQLWERLNQYDPLNVCLTHSSLNVEWFYTNSFDVNTWVCSVVWWWAPSPHGRGLLVWTPAGAFLCGVCMFSLWVLSGYPL